jgi:hypothetical protein
MKAALFPALLMLAAAALPACASKDEEGAAITADAPPAAPAPARPEPEFEAKVVSLPFRVDVTFSEGALAKLQETNVQLGVQADYFGTPKDPNAEGLDPVLGVWLGGEMQTIGPAPKSVTMKGQFDAGRVAREISGDPQVKVAVFPVRSYSAQAAITCPDFQEALPITVETGAVVHCKLVTE